MGQGGPTECFPSPLGPWRLVLATTTAPGGWSSGAAGKLAPWGWCSLGLTEAPLQVDPKPFYEACVHDSCSCDSGGDCECFCSAVATYAQECTKEAACVYWRTPDLCRECLPPTWGPPLGGGQHCPPIPGRACAVLPCCPRPRTPGSGEDPRLTPLHPCLAAIFCDYYNPPNECEWHYEPCGNRSFETCRTLSGIHSNISVSHLEGEWPAPGVPLSQALGGLGAGGLRV